MSTQQYRNGGGQGTNQYARRGASRPSGFAVPTVLVDPALLDLPRGVSWDDLEPIEQFNLQYGIGLTSRRPSESARAFGHRRAQIAAQKIVRGDLGIKPDTPDKAGRMQGAVLAECCGAPALSFRRANRKDAKPEAGARWVGVYRSTLAVPAREPDQNWTPLLMSKVHSELGLAQGIKYPVARAGAILADLHELGFLDKEYDGSNLPVYRLGRDWQQAKLGVEKNCGPAVMAVLGEHKQPMKIDDIAIELWERGFIQQSCPDPNAVVQAAATKMRTLGLIQRDSTNHYQVAPDKLAPTIAKGEWEL
jgi:hypothetical protein